MKTTRKAAKKRRAKKALPASKRLRKRSPFEKGKVAAAESKEKKQKALKASTYNPSLKLQGDPAIAELRDAEFKMRRSWGI